ncbi:MAG: alpha/beta hydrolase [Rhodoferax sp.]|nr:alpha/beta hydrolase [Rhodoferax sp.]
MSPRANPATPSATAPQAIEEKNACVALGKRPAVDVRMYGRRRPGGGNPLVVHFHGGAFVAGDLDSGSTVARMLAQAGAVVVSLAYPLAPKHPFPDGVDAGYDVLEWAHKNRVKLAGQGARVYLAGEEAGGNIAAAVAAMSRDRGHPPLAGQILLSPMLDPCVGTASLRTAMAQATSCKWSEGWQQYLRCPMDAEHPYAVPGTSRRLAHIAPTLVLSGADDPLRDEARAYAERLRAAGIEVTYGLLSNAQNWPEALTQPVQGECACGAAVKQHFRDFFEATGGAPSSSAATANTAEPNTDPADASPAKRKTVGKTVGKTVDKPVSQPRPDDGRPGSS